MRINYFLLVILFGINSWGAVDQKPVVVASASMIADMAKNIGADFIEVQCIVPIGGDPHIYEPTPADARKVAEADLLLLNGLTFEGWINELIENSGTKAKSVIVTEGIEAIESSTYQNATDPHAWMTAKNGIIYSDNIRKALTALVPGEAEIFNANFLIYSKLLDDIDQYIFKQIESIPEDQRVLITSHDAFQYYGRRYGVRLESILGTSTDAEAQTGDIIRLNKIIKSNRVPAVFIESTVNPKLLQQLARDNQIEVGGKLFSDSIGDENSEAPSYAEMLRYNTDVIADALKKETRLTDTAENTPLIKGPAQKFALILGALLVLGFLIYLYFKLK